jgi:hypothetical protein
MASQLQAERGAAGLGDQGIVHLEELGGLGPAGQAQDPGERAPPGFAGRRDDVVVELAGQEDLVRGRLDLGEEFIGAFLAAQRRPEARLAERGAQRPGQVALGQVARACLPGGGGRPPPPPPRESGQRPLLTWIRRTIVSNVAASSRITPVTM